VQSWYNPTPNNHPEYTTVENQNDQMPVPAAITSEFHVKPSTTTEIMIWIRIRTMILYCSTSAESVLLRLSEPNYYFLLRPPFHHSHRITIPHIPLPVILATVIVLVLAPARSLQGRSPGITPMPSQGYQCRLLLAAVSVPSLLPLHRHLPLLEHHQQ
jgi:hypothetical protein